MEESVDYANKELCRLRDTISANSKESKIEIQTLRKNISISETEWKHQLSTLKAVLMKEQSKSKELERRLLETQDHAMKQIQELANDLNNTDDSKEQLLYAQGKIVKLENATATFQEEKNQILLNHQAETQRLKHACESYHRENHLALLEKNEMEKEYNAERAKSEQSQKELEKIERALLKVEEKYQLLMDEKMKLVHRSEDLELANKTLEQQKTSIFEGMRVLKEEFQALKEKAANDQTKAKEVLNIEVNHACYVFGVPNLRIRVLIVFFHLLCM